MPGELFQIREFSREEDYALVQGWSIGHGVAFPPVEILPPLGIVVTESGEDIAALWLYQAVGVGVCYPEYAVTRPGLSFGQARRAFLFALGFLKETARQMDYGVMVIHAKPAMQRVLSSAGFVVAEKHCVQMVAAT